MNKHYQNYIDILKEELIPAMGCTEPISLAYGGALAKDYLGGETPVRVKARCSRNLLKNAMCVKVPNTGGLIGVKAAVVAGLVGGVSSSKMEVISHLGEDDREKVRQLLEQEICTVEMLESPIPLHYILDVQSESHNVIVEISHKHTHIASLSVDGKNLDLESGQLVQTVPVDRSVLTVEEILEFAECVNIDDIRDVIGRQIHDNYTIALEGLTGQYGVDIGNLILSKEEDTVETKMKAYTAAASECRMEGCPLSVVINSGSGNQGITSSVPVIVYCRENHLPEEKMYRALALSNLLTIHQKTGIGTLSAFCGAVCASISASAAITYLKGGGLEEISATLSNSYGGVAGTICDGAKATCGFKIYSALTSAFLAGEMALRTKRYPGNTGIIRDTVEGSIQAIGKLGREGMAETDKKILQIMLED